MTKRNVRATTQLAIDRALRWMASATSALVLLASAGIVLFFLISAVRAILPDRIDPSSQVRLDARADDVVALSIAAPIPGRVGWLVDRAGRIQLFDRESGVVFERTALPLASAEIRRIAVSSSGGRVVFEDTAGRIGAAEVRVPSRRAYAAELGERWDDLELGACAAIDGGVVELGERGQLTRFDLRLVRDESRLTLDSASTALAIADDGRWAVATPRGVSVRTASGAPTQIEMPVPVSSLAFTRWKTWCGSSDGIQSIDAGGHAESVSNRGVRALTTAEASVLSFQDDGQVVRWDDELPVVVGRIDGGGSESELHATGDHFAVETDGDWYVGSMRTGRTSFSCLDEGIVALGRECIVRRQSDNGIAIDRMVLRNREVALTVPGPGGATLTALGASSIGTLRLLFWTLLIAVPVSIFVALDASELSGRSRRRRILSANHFIGGTPAIAIALFFSQIIAPLLRANAVRTIVVLALLPFALAIVAPVARIFATKLGSMIRTRALFAVATFGALTWVSGPTARAIEKHGLGETPALYLEGVGPPFVAWLLMLFPIVAVGVALPLQSALRRAVTEGTRISPRFEPWVPALGPTVALVITLLASGLGAFALGAFADPRGPWIAGGIDWSPFGQGSSSTLIAAFAVAVVATPIMISATVGLFRSVPTELRIASYGVGASRVQTAIRVVMSVTWPGLIGVVCLGAARAVGETMAVLWLVERAGPESSSGVGLFGSFSTWTQFIVDEVRRTDGGVPPVVLLAAAFVFFATWILNAIGEFLRTRYRQ